MDQKFPKSTKSTKKTKSAKSNQCICPCCSEDSCQDLMDAVEGGLGVNDGTGPFCAVNGATSFKMVDTFRDICLYDLDGNLDPTLSCIDDNNNCAEWAAEGECSSNAGYMLENCKFSCGACLGLSQNLGDLGFLTGDLDILAANTGRQNLADCCVNLGVEHSGGYCEARRKRSRKLNRASASNERTVTTHKDGVTVEVKAAEPSSLDWIHYHVIEMKEHMEQDDVTGEWDSLFEAYFDNSHHIDMNCDTDSADSLSCKYSSQTQCGRDLISAHAGYHKEMADSIRNGGSHKIAKEQLKPDSCP